MGGTAGGAVLTPRTYLINSKVFGNSAPLSGATGGVVGGQIVNSQIVGNYGDGLGGVRLGRADPGIVPSISNSVVAYNESDDDVAGIHLHGTQPVQIDNTIIWANEGIGIPSQDMQIGGEFFLARVNHSCVQFWQGSLMGVRSFGDNPQFLDPLGPDGIAGTQDDDFRLPRSSPCVDAGDNLLVAADEGDLDGDGDLFEPTPFDHDGAARFACGWTASPTGSGSAPLVDTGPYEVQVVCIPDFNADCRLDIFDFLGFQGAFFLMDPRADLDQSTGVGVFDIFDFITFQDLFLAGCQK